MLSKLTELSKKQTILLALSAVLFFLLIMLFLGRGLVRETLFPAYLSRRYESRVKQAYEIAKSELQDPITTFELSKQVNPIIGNKACDLNTAAIFSIEGSCFVGSPLLETTINQDYLTKHKEDFASLEINLVKHGWTTELPHYGDNATTITGLLNSSGEYGHVTSRYDKTINGVSCWLMMDRWAGFQEGEPERISGVLTCRKDGRLGL